MYRKVLIVFISIILDISPMVRTTFLLLITAFSLFLTITKKPFSVTDLNELEIKAQVSAIITLYSGMMYLNTVDELTQAIFFMILLITNVVFFYFWFKSLVLIFFSAKAQRIYDCCPNFFDKIIAFSDGDN
jgi:hypothetical protein